MFCIVVSGFDGGMVFQNVQVVVYGYVLDDVGVMQIKVNDQFVIIEGSYKIVNFKFQFDVKNGKVEYIIMVCDVVGYISKEIVIVVVDMILLQIQVKLFNCVGNLIWVLGVVIDNICVVQILIDGNWFNIMLG